MTKSRRLSSATAPNLLWVFEGGGKITKEKRPQIRDCQSKYLRVGPQGRREIYGHF